MRQTSASRFRALSAKPEVGIQFGAGGATTPEELEPEGTYAVGCATDLARRCLDAGAYMIMIESEGITEEVTSWRTDVVATIAHELGLRAGGQPVHRPLAGRPPRVPAPGDLGHQEPLGVAS